MDHVAEIQNTADGGRFGVAQQIMAMAVAMYRLTAQRPQRGHASIERRRHLLDRLSERSGFYVRGVFHELGKAPHIPGQSLCERGMEEALQCSIQTRQHIAEIVQQRRVRSALPEQLSRQVTHEAGRVAAVFSLDSTPLGALSG